jgi:hypothetical protein
MTLPARRIASASCAAVAGLIGAFLVEAGASVRVAHAQSQPSPPPDYISGVVQSGNGPEAGVWVIAETSDLPTNFIKIVVTGDNGRFALPQLPNANYRVWVRGYGLVDSTPVKMKPQRDSVTLRAEAAKTPQEAAKVYPGDYWLSLLEPPSKSEFPGTGPDGNGLGQAMLTQNHWVYRLKSDCNFCHQLGNRLTRSLDHVFKAKPDIKTSAAAWEWRLGTGVRGNAMYGAASNMGIPRTTRALADWTDRIARGEVPPVPARPKGLERNLVLTLWDWGTDHSFMHDEISTAKNNPRVNAGGRVYAVSAGHGELVVLDPKESSTFELEIPTRAPRLEVPSRFPKPNRPSLWWGEEHLWGNPPYDPADPHNPMMDSKGRVWMTSKIRPNQNASWCTDAANKFAEWFPIQQSFRQVSFYDPRTKEFTLIDTCYSTHHLQFDTDADETLYLNELTGPIVGWVDTKVYEQTHDEQKAVGWCGQVLDTNGDGKITRPWNRQPGGRGRAAAQPAPFDPKLDTLVNYNLYSIIANPVDHSLWGASEEFPGFLVRVERGSDPPSTCRAEIYRVPEPGLDPRGIDVDRNGVIWTALAASSHLASFDRRKCKVFGGPEIREGNQCREGWTLYQTTGPKLKGTDIPAEFHYYNWVDQYNTLGLGENMPMATGSNSDSLLVLNPQTKEWITLRVPYPLGFYSRGLDGRIDDANAGWKGRGVWANYGTHFVWHIEGGKGTKGKLVHFQIRPDPLAH